MEPKFDCITSLYPDKRTPWQEAPHRGVITDGLSEEAIFYVNQAVARTDENDYSVFDKYGLMPDSYDCFDYMAASGMMKVCDYGEYGTIYTADERFMITSDKEKGTRTVYYDSDGINGYDRTATYMDTPAGNIKTQETFDADGDGTNEVEITRSDIRTNTLTFARSTTEKNPKYNWIDKVLNIFGYGDDEYINNYWYEDVTSIREYDLEIGVNADDLGYDPVGGNHVEYCEKVTVFPEGKTRKSHQAYYDWRYADKYQYDAYSK